MSQEHAVCGRRRLPKTAPATSGDRRGNGNLARPAKFGFACGRDVEQVCCPCRVVYACSYCCIVFMHWLGVSDERAAPLVMEAGAETGAISIRRLVASLHVSAREPTSNVFVGVRAEGRLPG